MNVSGERTFSAPRATVWRVLNDPASMAIHQVARGLLAMAPLELPVLQLLLRKHPRGAGASPVAKLCQNPKSSRHWG